MPGMYRRRANLAHCTVNMLGVLKRLRDAKQAGQPFVYLDDVHGRTIRALIGRDWIMQSVCKKGHDRNRYTITGRGEKACAVYEVPPEDYDKRRFDNICCRCEKRERSCYESGRRKPYCDECQRAISKRKRKLGIHQKNPGICPTCGERDKHIAPSGKVRSYCLPCRRQKSKIYRERGRKRAYAKVQAGEVLMCYRCKKRPRWVTGRTVQDYCEDCAREYHKSRRRL